VGGDKGKKEMIKSTCSWGGLYNFERRIKNFSRPSDGRGGSLFPQIGSFGEKISRGQLKKALDGCGKRGGLKDQTRLARSKLRAADGALKILK